MTRSNEAGEAVDVCKAVGCAFLPGLRPAVEFARTVCCLSLHFRKLNSSEASSSLIGRSPETALDPVREFLATIDWI